MLYSSNNCCVQITSLQIHQIKLLHLRLQNNIWGKSWNYALKDEAVMIERDLSQNRAKIWDYPQLGGAESEEGKCEKEIWFLFMQPLLLQPWRSNPLVPMVKQIWASIFFPNFVKFKFYCWFSAHNLFLPFPWTSLCSSRNNFFSFIVRIFILRWLIWHSLNCISYSYRFS